MTAALLILWRGALPILRVIWPYLLGTALLAAYTAYWDHRGASRVQAKFDAYKLAQKEIVDRVTKDWVAQTAKTERAALVAQEHRDFAFSQILKESHALPPLIRNVAVAPAVISLLDSARIAATAGPAPEPAKAPDPDSAVTQGQLTDWAIDVLRIHRECTDRVAEWAEFYQGLRKAQ